MFIRIVIFSLVCLCLVIASGCIELPIPECIDGYLYNHDDKTQPITINGESMTCGGAKDESAL